MRSVGHSVSRARFRCVRSRFVDWTIPDVVYLARVATELGDASGADLCSAGRHPGGGSSARRAGGPVGGQFRSRGRTTSHTVSPTRTSNSTPIASHPSEPIPFPKPPIIGELLLRLPSSSGKPTSVAAGCCVRGQESWSNDEGNWARSAWARRGQSRWPGPRVSIRGRHPRVASRRPGRASALAWVRDGEGIGSRDTRSSQSTRIHLRRMTS